MDFMEFPPDMDSGFLDGEKFTLRIALGGKESIIDRIAEHFHIGKSTVLTGIFLMGLFLDGWDILRLSSKYQTDSAFRDFVDEMPHDVAFDSE